MKDYKFHFAVDLCVFFFKNKLITLIPSHINTITSSSSSLAQLFVLNEASKHLGIHEELQELSDSTGGVRFAEAFALELPASIGCLDHVERIMAHQLHKEPHKTLRHQRAQVSLLTWTGHILDEDKQVKSDSKIDEIYHSFTMRYRTDFSMKCLYCGSQTEALQFYTEQSFCSSHQKTNTFFTT